MRLIAIILCLALTLGAIIFLTTSPFFNQSKTANTPPEKSLPTSVDTTPDPVIKNEQPEILTTDPDDELQTQAKLTKAISQHANKTAENDLLRHQAQKLEQEIQQKIQSLEQKKSQ